MIEFPRQPGRKGHRKNNGERKAGQEGQERKGRKRGHGGGVIQRHTERRRQRERQRERD